MKRGAVWLGGAVALLVSSGAWGLEIAHVQHDPVAFDPAKREPVTVRFRLSEPARVALRIFDGRDLAVRTVVSPRAVPAGDAKLLWDGRDEAGRPVPADAYHYTLQATAANGAQTEYDVTDYTGGDDLEAQAVAYDPVTRQISYSLPAAARVNVRVALKKGGPLLGTVIDWVPRTAGGHREWWDGEGFGAGDLSHHPNLDIIVQAFALPQNTILALPEPDRVRLIEKPSWPAIQRVVKRTPAKRMYAHSQQPIEARGDFRLELRLPPSLPRNAAGLAVVSGTVPVQVDVAATDRERALATRFESVFYLDGQYVLEHEMGYLPTTVEWDFSAVNRGEHFLTANLRGYEGNFGAATVKVLVADPPKPEDAGGQSRLEEPRGPQRP